jgi:hypothetical protein
LEFGELDEEPVSEGLRCFDRREKPARCCRYGLHLLGLGEPVFDGELPVVEVPYAPESKIVTEELNNVAVARPGVVGERFDITAGERSQPGPGVVRECG